MILSTVVTSTGSHQKVGTFRRETANSITLQSVITHLGRGVLAFPPVAMSACCLGPVTFSHVAIVVIRKCRSNKKFNVFFSLTTFALLHETLIARSVDSKVCTERISGQQQVLGYRRDT